MKWFNSHENISYFQDPKNRRFLRVLFMYSFRCFGHKNITSSHKNTLEFTKDKDIGKIAHCIIGVNADFSLDKLKEAIKDKEKIRITIEADNIKDKIDCIPNKDFGDNREIVIRISDFVSERTLGIRADKASKDIKKELKEKLTNPNQEITIKIE